MTKRRFSHLSRAWRVSILRATLARLRNDPMAKTSTWYKSYRSGFAAPASENDVDALGGKLSIPRVIDERQIVL